jgi:surface protein
MFGMFNSATAFNQDISNWNVSNVKDASWMFANSDFKKNINNWQIQSSTDTTGMFNDTLFEEQNDIPTPDFRIIQISFSPSPIASVSEMATCIFLQI